MKRTSVILQMSILQLSMMMSMMVMSFSAFADEPVGHIQLVHCTVKYPAEAKFQALDLYASMEGYQNSPGWIVIGGLAGAKESGLGLGNLLVPVKNVSYDEKKASFESDNLSFSVPVGPESTVETDYKPLTGGEAVKVRLTCTYN